jgi:hypothetical protein
MEFYFEDVLILELFLKHKILHIILLQNNLHVVKLKINRSHEDIASQDKNIFHQQNDNKIYKYG